MNRAEGAASDAWKFLAGGGEMGALLRDFDWAAHPLGDPAFWPQSLKTAIRIMLTSRQPIWIGWGQDLFFFYNDAYQSIIGGKHPKALAQPAKIVWQEIWDDIGPMLATAMTGIEGTYVEEQLLIMERNGYPEETYYTFSYSPIPDDDGTPGGIICANTEDTDRVIGERQLALLRDLADRCANARSWADVCRLSAEALRQNAYDLPFALIYMGETESAPLRLVASAGFESALDGAPQLVERDATSPWPAGEAHTGAAALTVANLPDRLGGKVPTGAWSRAPQQAAVMRIAPTGDIGPSGLLVVGLNPFRLFDEAYGDFLGLVAGQIGAAVANANAYEQERKRAEALAELDRAKTTFFSNVSHEFRTPLTLMLGPLEESLANSANLPPEEVERLMLVQRSSSRLLKLVNTLLDFSRIEAGRTQAIFEPTDLGDFTAELASNFRSATERAGLELKIDCAARAEPVYVDREMWEKIVLNLLSNAFKFTFAGEIRVGLTQASDRAVLEIGDTGTGIPASELPRLFDRFHRIEGARGRSFEGSGIGLALVKELVELHGGTITAESEEGGGSVFRVSIPLGRAHLPPQHVREAAAARPAPTRARPYVEEALSWLPDTGGQPISPVDEAAHGEEPAGARQGRARLLLADDNADMRIYLRRLLQARHECVAVADGEAALEQLRSGHFDLILTDAMMPRLDGFELLKAIRSDAKLRDLPVIMLSARAGEEASVEGIAAGADDYLTKPFSARELIARIDGALAMAKIRRERNQALAEEAQTLEWLNRIGNTVAAELDLGRAVQVVTDAATELTGAAFGAFFYNVLDDKGESYMLYTLSGVPREAFSRFPMPRNTKVFAPTFNGEGIVRSEDILTDPRYGHNDPHYGMPKGHLPVRSYLAAPVISRSGEVLGGLFFGHPEPGIFTERAERLVAGIAAQAAIAIDNARLYQAAQSEIAARKQTESALRASEEKLLHLNQTLEERVAERTMELADANEELRKEAEERERVEAALRHSQKMEAIGKLTGGIAHDFNNLLQVVGGNLQLLTKDVAGQAKPEQRVRNALAGVSRGAKLASQLLAFGRRQPLAPKVVNLGRLVRNLDELLRRALGEGIEIETVIGAGLWNTLVDPAQVENALLNLAINARDAMNGQGKLTIEAGNAALSDEYARAHDEVAPGQYVMLAVTDTGTGMTPEVQERAFEPFFTTKPEGHGTGLGLSMVYGFARQSNGHIKIYSELGQGTTIRLYLPRAMQPEDIAIDVESGPVVGGTETVLVVEDDDEVRATVVDLLTELGYHVLKARDAQSGLAIVESGIPIDVLFTDVVMPGTMRSPELARRARERLPEIAVLFTSGYTDNAIIHSGRIDPGVELLSKPYTREALARRLRHVLASRPERKPPAEIAPTMADEVQGRPRSRRILLVEDDALIRMATADMLTDLGHEVIEAGDGAQALAVLEAQSVDLLITDIGLPGISGIELAKTARAREADLPVIFATGVTPSADDGISEAVPGAVLLLKPYSVPGLIDAIKALQIKKLG
jgi:signal transduction histidine kinase/DNA-binding response OmpR family regulator